MEAPTKFTQEIKDNWVQNLESGKYKQGFGTLHYGGDNSFCCIGVLGDVVEGLNNDYPNHMARCNPYLFLRNTIGENLMAELYDTNDDYEYRKTGKRDYSNVLPLIKSLPVQS